MIFLICGLLLVKTKAHYLLLYAEKNISLYLDLAVSEPGSSLSTNSVTQQAVYGLRTIRFICVFILLMPMSVPSILNFLLARTTLPYLCENRKKAYSMNFRDIYMGKRWHFKNIVKIRNLRHAKRLPENPGSLFYGNLFLFDLTVAVFRCMPRYHRLHIQHDHLQS